MDTEKKYCSKTISLPIFYGSFKDGCGKPATHKDSHGRHLCEKHYNQWMKKVNKSKANDSSSK